MPRSARARRVWVSRARVRAAAANPLSDRMAAGEALPLSSTEQALIRFLNAPFALVMPVLVGVIAAMLWTMSKYG